MRATLASATAWSSRPRRGRLVGHGPGRARIGWRMRQETGNSGPGARRTRGPCSRAREADGRGTTPPRARGLLRHGPDSVRGPRGLAGRRAGASRLRAVPRRPRPRRRASDAAGGRCRRRLLDDDVRRAGAGGIGRRRRVGRTCAGRDGCPDHEHPRAGSPRQRRAVARRRLHPGLVPVLLRARRRRFRGVRAGGRDSGARGRDHRLQHVLDVNRHLVRHGRTPCRGSERGRAQVGDPTDGRDGVRGRDLALSRTASRSSTTTSTSPSARCRRSERRPSKCTSATSGPNGGLRLLDEAGAATTRRSPA